MGRRDLLSADERAKLFSIPVERDALARCYGFGPDDLALIERRREDRNRLGFAVQLVLMRHPGLTLSQVLAGSDVDVTPLVGFVAEQLKLPASGFDDYAGNSVDRKREPMSEAETATLIEMTSEIVAAYVAKNHVQASEVPVLISTVHASLVGLGKAPEAAPEPTKLTPPVSIKKSVTDDYLISLEDGKQYQSLKRHLAGRGLTPDEYRKKWGLPADYPMVAPGYSARRSELAKSIGLGSLRRQS